MRDVLLALGTAITRVGYGKGTDWDKFYMWQIEYLKPYENAASAPAHALDELVGELDSLVLAEGLIEARQHRDAQLSGSAFALTTHTFDPQFDTEPSNGYESLISDAELSAHAEQGVDRRYAYGVSTPTSAYGSGTCPNCHAPRVRGSDLCEPCGKPLYPTNFCDACGFGTRKSY